MKIILGLLIAFIGGYLIKDFSILLGVVLLIIAHNFIDHN